MFEETAPGALAARRRAIAANAVIIPLCYATGRLSADLVQLYAIQVLELTPGQVGLALGLLVLSIPFQLAAVTLPTRLGYRLNMRGGYLAILILLGLFAALPSLLRYGPLATLIGFVGVLLAIEIAISVSWGVAWHPWMRRLVPPTERPGFVAHMQMTTQLTAVAIVVGFGALSGGVVSATEYQVLLALIGALLVVSIVLMGGVPDFRSPPQDRTRSLSAIKQALSSSMRIPSLRRLSIIFVLDGALMVPLVVVYGVVYLGVGAGTMAIIIAIRGAAGPASLLCWRRVHERIGVLRTIRWTMGGVAVTRAGWLLVAAESRSGAMTTAALLCALLVAAAVLTAGFGNANLTAWYGAVPDRGAAGIFALRDIVASSKTQLTAAVGGAVLSLTAVLGSITVGPVHLDAFKVFLLLGVPVALLITKLAESVPGDAESPEEVPLPAPASDGGSTR